MNNNRPPASNFQNLSEKLVIKFHWPNGVNKLAERSIRVTVLLEYLDLAFATRSWLSNHNSVVCNPILLYYCKDFQ